MSNESSNGQAISICNLSEIEENESQSGLSIKQENQETSGQADIQTLGWTGGEKFFVVRVNHDVVIWEDDIRGVCGIYNCEKFAGKYCGCRFVEKFALVNGNDVYVSAPVIDQEYCIDDPFIKITLAEFKELKG